VWLRILDLGPPPTAHGVVVACLMADGEGRPVEVARTPLSSRLDPFFDAPLALRGAASGKGSGRPLTFAVLALSGAGEEALVAEAHIASDRLRDCGRLQGLTPGTRLSGVVALPLCAPGDAQQPLPKAALHCLVLAGPSGGGAAGASPAPRSARGGAATGAAASAAAAAAAAAPPPGAAGWAPALALDHTVACCPAAAGGGDAVAVRLRGRNLAAAALRVHAAALALPAAAAWELVATPPMRGAAVPPGGEFHAAFVARRRAGAAAGGGFCDAEARVTYSLDAPAVEAAEASSAAAPPPPKPPAATLPLGAALALALVGAGADMVATRAVRLEPPERAAPLVARVRRADPAAPSVGQLVELAVDLRLRAGARLDAPRTAAAASDAAAGGGGEALELEVHAAAGDWALVGAHRQRIALPPPPAGGGGGGGERQLAALEWKLVPLRAGRLKLPTLAVLGGDGATLPPAVYDGDGTLHVRPL
jgi:hypothetical protein